ncbi:Uma2 family endonuclease [Virgibacillus oceani]
MEDNVIYEVISGKIISMSPSPTEKHQDVSGELSAELKMFLHGEDCKSYSAPMDVCLFADNETAEKDIQDWVQPDIFAVYDADKITEKKITGAPDFIIGVLSPSTASNDCWIKYNSYEKAGVKEYWIVGPMNMTVEVNKLEKGSYKQTGVYDQNDEISPGIFPELKIELNDGFCFARTLLHRLYFFIHGYLPFRSFLGTTSYLFILPSFKSVSSIVTFQSLSSAIVHYIFMLNLLLFHLTVNIHTSILYFLLHFP